MWLLLPPRLPPSLAQDAEMLDDMTFEMWVYNATPNRLARLMMVLAGSEQGAVAEPWWTSALHVARQVCGTSAKGCG